MWIPGMPALFHGPRVSEVSAEAQADTIRRTKQVSYI